MKTLTTQYHLLALERSEIHRQMRGVLPPEEFGRLAGRLHEIDCEEDELDRSERE